MKPIILKFNPVFGFIVYLLSNAIVLALHFAIVYFCVAPYIRGMCLKSQTKAVLVIMEDTLTYPTYCDDLLNDLFNSTEQTILIPAYKDCIGCYSKQFAKASLVLSAIIIVPMVLYLVVRRCIRRGKRKIEQICVREAEPNDNNIQQIRSRNGSYNTKSETEAKIAKWSDSNSDDRFTEVTSGKKSETAENSLDHSSDQYYLDVCSGSGESYLEVNGDEDRDTNRLVEMIGSGIGRLHKESQN